ncbi:cytochrome b5 domain-containing protein [Limosilactobacillus fastidiosus]|uniref:Cytochrome B5 n=1 Tax=Limosilactobacillus fastidiosus TaxID=2759855 RepID=A0A7W3U115_9LACO|nr:cytochrome b5 domain-containing protein [Limosilactobacillus fastidiosus]MBB1062257.1 cytochrome B5 [Limosilactobacillus fastidiosus]MBB1086675.1 cytochrome B5 [Limosilactobacillus fastidiosus]MCD7083334.1 cytochrome B5 [Limosilactobacillus fastidiosus]MCD7086347.1 cytochrome B5 [Limosilactobacillus fastidiosus]MCD7115358.1 cytochrome B5 [Limosilactobacillus fastidiosus]
MTTRTFSAEELAKYNGQDGNPAYVAVEGTVYDVSNIPAWRNGKHHGNLAGHDVSAAIKRSLHMKRVLESLPVVGKFTGDPEV